MMEHVRQFDWCSSVYDRYFVDEADLDNCNTEKILRNKFVDPLLSSDSEDDEQPNKINWDEIFKGKEIFKHKLFVPCLRPVPPYPKLSALNSRQHNMLLKVLSAENPRVLEDLFLGKPTRQDMKAFEAAKETYLKEQKEYQDWAKSLWTTDHCIRALRPKPAVENVYEAEYKVKAQRMRPLPKQYDVAAQIALGTRRNNCEAVLKQELIGVSLADMPLVEIPEKIERQLSIIRPCTVPEPCQKHPYQIILPNEDSLSMLPITEIHRELALFALTNGSQYIASENALKCLVQWNRHWMLPLSVCETIGPEGDRVNVLVLDSEFSTNKESAPMRTYKAFRHLLEHALISSSERERVYQRLNNTAKKKDGTFDASAPAIMEDVEMTSDDEDHTLFIDTGEDVEMNTQNGEQNTQQPNNGESEEDVAVCPRIPVAESGGGGYVTRAVSRRISEECQDIGVYSCTCKGTLYEKPPRRSFKRWQFQNKVTNENHDIIIHCPHKARDTSGELILEPIPEYQIDLGASEQSADSIRSLALSLALRKNTSILNVRVDGPTGDVVRLDPVPAEQFCSKYPDVTRQVLSTVHAALGQLQGLLPGHYVLQHEPSHGTNALLMSPAGAAGAAGGAAGAARGAAGAARGAAGAGAGGRQAALVLQFESAQLSGAEEAQLLRAPPTITTDLLPFHKFRRVLPCAFTSFDNQLVKEPKKPPPKKKAPPQALKWPKRKKNRKKNW